MFSIFLPTMHNRSRVKATGEARKTKPVPCRIVSLMLHQSNYRRTSSGDQKKSSDYTTAKLCNGGAALTSAGPHHQDLQRWHLVSNNSNNNSERRSIMSIREEQQNAVIIHRSLLPGRTWRLPVNPIAAWKRSSEYTQYQYLRLCMVVVLH